MTIYIRNCKFLFRVVTYVFVTLYDEISPRLEFLLYTIVETRSELNAKSTKEKLGNRSLTENAATILRAYLARFCRHDLR